MKKLNEEKVRDLLCRIMEFELAGVVRYTHYSLMVTGPNRLPIVQFMKAQANESLLHAQQAGELLTGLGGHPTLHVAQMEESNRHSVEDVLRESVRHERAALELYGRLLDTVKDRSVYLEEYARGQIAQEELHGLELRKMQRDIGITASPVNEDVHEHEHAPEEAKKAKKARKAAKADASSGSSDDKAVKKDKKKA